MNINDENYFIVSGFMVNRLHLKGTTLNVFAIIYGFTQDGESEFKGSRQYLCDFTGATKPTIDKALQDLCDQEFIIKITTVINGVTFNKYKANLSVIKNFTGDKETLSGSQETLSGVVKKLEGGSQETLPDNINNNKPDIDKNIIESMSCDLLNYLNEKAGTHYKPVESNLKFIKKLILKNYSAAEIKTAIDKKVKEWKGTKMQMYLRPETLFNETKFENYLNGLSNDIVDKYKSDINGGCNVMSEEECQKIVEENRRYLDSIQL